MQKNFKPSLHKRFNQILFLIAEMIYDLKHKLFNMYLIVS